MSVVSRHKLYGLLTGDLSYQSMYAKTALVATDRPTIIISDDYTLIDVLKALKRHWNVQCLPRRNQINS